MTIEKTRANRKAYRQSEHGKAVRKAYRQTERARASQKAYRQTDSQKAYARAYGQTEHQKAYRKAYRQAINGHLRQVFGHMKYRCNNPEARNYDCYGGRGIKVLFNSADEFVDYVTNVLQVDPRGLQIDRIDNDGNYEPGNIRFVTCTENNNNKSRDNYE